MALFLCKAEFLIKNYMICIIAPLLTLCLIFNVYAAQHVLENSGNIDNRVFLTLKTDKAHVGVNESISVSVKLFVNKANIKDIFIPTFIQNDLSVAKFEEPKQYKETINNISYDVLDFKTKLLGTKPGVYKIGPAKTTCNIVVKNNDPNTDSEYQYVPFELKSQAVEVVIDKEKNSLIVDVIMTIFGFALGIFVVVKLFRPIVKMTILSIYRSVKRKDIGLSEKELLKRTVQKRYALALKGCPREEIINAIEGGAILNIDELVKYMLEKERGVYMQGSIKKDNTIFKNLKWYEHLAAGWPIILIFVGGAIGGGLGAAAYILNVRIFNKSISSAKKYIFSILIGIASVLACFIVIVTIAIIFPGFFKKPH